MSRSAPAAWSWRTRSCVAARRTRWNWAATPRVRINGVVHVNTVLEDEALVPIGWVAVGSPARIIAPWDHDEIWRIQHSLDFPRTVYGLPREATARERMEKQTEWFGAHRDDRPVD